MPTFPVEPFRIKMVEPIQQLSRKERETKLAQAGYSPFNLRAEDIFIDLLTDSGTNAMSDNQWAGILHGDESYAGARSFYNLDEVVKRIFGFKHFIPVHQGRAGEHVLFSVMIEPGDVVPSNTHFSTTRGNLAACGAETVDFAIDAAGDLASDAPFKGDMDVEKLERFIEETGADRIPLGLTTVTNNTANGFAVSMANVRATGEVYRRHGIPFFIDACRYAENCYFIKQHEPGYADKPMLDIANELFGYADGMIMSGKKDALINIGGLLCLDDDALALKVKEALFLREGFHTYGGLAGRDLEATARGLWEGLDEDYLAYRIGHTRYLGERLRELGVPVVWPPSGHAVFINAGAMLPHIPQHQSPAMSLVVALYLEGGIRAGALGRVSPYADTTATAADAQTEPGPQLVRLAIPRRVYTQAHLDYVARVAGHIASHAGEVRGLRITPGYEDRHRFELRFELV